MIKVERTGCITAVCLTMSRNSVATLSCHVISSITSSIPLAAAGSRRPPSPPAPAATPLHAYNEQCTVSEAEVKVLCSCNTDAKV